MKGNRLYKIEKLCGKTAIESLFSHDTSSSHNGTVVYPLRAVWSINHRRDVSCPKFLIMVPKRRLHHAVERVTMRRRIRETYRLNRDLIPRDIPLDIAFIYVASELLPYNKVERAMTRALSRIKPSLDEHQALETVETDSRSSD